MFCIYQHDTDINVESTNIPTITKPYIDPYKPITIQENPELAKPANLMTLPDLSTIYITNNLTNPYQLTLPPFNIRFRESACPYTPNPKCCGGCTRFCNKRCMFDALMRYDYMSKITNPSKVVQLAVKAIKRNPDKATLYRMIGQVMDDDELKNNWRFDYGPQIERNPQTNFPVVGNRDTGEYVIYAFPETGLCPFCLPNATHRRLRSDRRT